MSDPNQNPFAANPFATTANPFGTASIVDTSYAAPSAGAWEYNSQAQEAQEDEDEEDEPFTAAHLAAAQAAAVPAVGPGVAAPAAPAARQQPIAFTSSTQPPPGPMTGRVGAPAPDAASGGSPGRSSPSPVPRVGSAASASLLAAPSPSTPAVAPEPPEDPSKYPFYSVKRYRTYFNVDTQDVLIRIFWSTVLFFRGNFLERVGGNPDLYGPFWVATTLIFVSAATGNLASYLAYRRDEAGGSGDTPVSGWYYDVDKVGGSFGLFYGYVGVVGLCLYACLRWFKAGVSLAAVWCTYGYALAIFIPVSFVCVFPIESMRWAVLGGATGISAIFILLTFRKPIHESVGAKALPLLLVLLALHLGLGLALKLYFFRYKDSISV